MQAGMDVAQLRLRSYFGILFLLISVGITVYTNVVFQSNLFPIFPYPIYISLASGIYQLLFLYPSIKKQYGLAKWQEYSNISPTVQLVTILSNTLYNWSLLMTSMSTVIVISSLSTIFSLVFSRFLLRTPINVSTLVSIHLSVIGCVLVTTTATGATTPTTVVPPAENFVTTTSREHSYGEHILGCLLAVCSAGLSALTSVLVKYYKICEYDLHLSISGLVNLGIFILFLFVNTCLFQIENYQFAHSSTLSTWYYISINGIGCSVIGYKLFLMALGRLSPITVNVLYSLSIPMAVFVDYLRGELKTITPLFLFGSFLVLVSTVLVPVEQEDTRPDPTPDDSSVGEQVSLVEYHRPA